MREYFMGRSNHELGCVLDEVFDVLDEEIGDTDPPIDDTWTDDEIREEYPLFWAIRRVNEVRDTLKNSEPAAAPA